MVMRSGWHLSGIQELKRGGLDISGGALVRVKAGFFLTIRIALSIGLAQLTAIFVSLLIFQADIQKRFEGTYLQANAQLIAPAAELVDAAIHRATDAVNVQTARVNALSAQVGTLQQSEIDPFAGDAQAQELQREIARLRDEQSKADQAVQAAETFAANEFGGIRGAPGNSGQPGYGLRYRAAQERVKSAKTHADQIAKALSDAQARLDTMRNQNASSSDAMKQRARDQLPAFEESLKAENATLARLKDDLARLTEGREKAIRQAVDVAPNHVSRETGFLAQIVALEQIAHGDTKITLLILLIDIVSFGFELAAVLAKITSYVPTTYAALLARDAYMVAVRLADEMAGELKGLESRSQQQAATAASVAMAKRPRGRPRKHPLPVPATGANGQDSSGQPSLQPKPA
jgi:hypothetical protein